MTKAKAFLGVGAAALVVGALLILARWPAPSPFAASDSRTTAVHTQARIGEIVHMGFGVFPFRTKAPIRIESATLLDLPKGLHVEGMYWFRLLGGAPSAVSAVIRPHLHSVGVTLRPGTDAHRWQLEAGLYANRIGRYRTGDLRICYIVRGRHGCTTISGDVVGIDVSLHPAAPFPGPIVTPWPRVPEPLGASSK